MKMDVTNAVYLNKNCLTKKLKCGCVHLQDKISLKLYASKESHGGL
jgi:hypothetical protein